MKQKNNQIQDYAVLLDEVRDRIRSAQTQAVLSANAEMIKMYFDIGRIIQERQQREGWGAAVISRLSKDIQNELPKVKGFSERNLKRMIRFYREYAIKVPQIVAQNTDTMHKEKCKVKVPQAVAQIATNRIDDQLLQIIVKIPWGHNIILIEKISALQTRLWYMQQTLENGWTRDVLASMIKSRVHERQGLTVNNFDTTLPHPQSDIVRQALKDPYIFDFLTLDKPFLERELELGLIGHLEKFLLELGQGFAFVGRQYHLDVGEDDFYIDLLFYHLRLRCYIVIDLKTGTFKPEYAGKMNFYCNVVDDQLKHKTDNPTIGLILCQDKKKILAEYALRGMNKPIGISEYELTRTLPDELKSALPSIEALEKELSEKTNGENEL